MMKWWSRGNLKQDYKILKKKKNCLFKIFGGIPSGIPPDQILVSTDAEIAAQVLQPALGLVRYQMLQEFWSFHIAHHALPAT